MIYVRPRTYRGHASVELLDALGLTHCPGTSGVLHVAQAVLCSQAQGGYGCAEELSRESDVAKLQFDWGAHK